jgi:hypothetical protein
VIRVLIVDDHEVVRHGLRFVLAQEDGIETVGNVRTGRGRLPSFPRCGPTSCSWTCGCLAPTGSRCYGVCATRAPGLLSWYRHARIAAPSVGVFPEIGNWPREFGSGKLGTP